MRFETRFPSTRLVSLSNKFCRVYGLHNKGYPSIRLDNKCFFSIHKENRYFKNHEKSARKPNHKIQRRRRVQGTTWETRSDGRSRPRSCTARVL